MLKSLKLKYSLMLGYIIPLMLSVVVVLVVYANLKKIEYQSSLADSSHAVLEEISSLELSISRMQQSARGFLLMPEDTAFNNYMNADRTFQQNVEELGKMVRDTSQAELLRNIVQTANQTRETTTQEIALVKEGNAAKAIEIYRSGMLTGLSRELRNKIVEFKAKEIEIKNERQKNVDLARTLSIRVLFIGTALAIIIAILLEHWISSSIRTNILEAVNTTSTTSVDIAATITQHERSANNQAAMVSETTTTMAELGASSRHTAEQAGVAADMAKKANEITEDGAEAVRQTIDAMEKLKVKIVAISEQILNLSGQTEQIGGISELVKDLSGQINMLALNAAVEAARAGEYGKGFGVVASEVRKLSVESKKSAEQARGIVSGIQKATDAVIMKTEEGMKHIENVTLIAEKLNNLFDELSQTAGFVFNSAQQVLLNATEQASAINQVVEAANSINAGAKETAAGISQTKIGIHNLNDATVLLKNMI